MAAARPAAMNTCTWSAYTYTGSAYRVLRGTALPLLLGLLLALPLAAQTVTGADNRQITIPRLNAEPVLDGRLDDAIWQQAVLIDDLRQVLPVEFGEPSQRTEVRIFYTEDALFVGARMWDTQAGEIRAQAMRQGSAINSDDFFSVSIDPYLDRRSGYRFALNPNSVRWEALYNNITELESNWDGIWQGQSSIDDEGWTAEIRIPFQTLSFNPNTSDWGLNLQRIIRRHNETIAWTSRDRQINPSTAGTMRGINDIRQGLGLDVVPSFSMRRERVLGPAGFAENHFEPSLDVFYKVTSSLNAALTINTDFSAAEVDDRQVNLTRFNLFFPEKRDFFIRDADIFEFGQIGLGGFNFNDGTGNGSGTNASRQNARPFFSRRIGLSPSGTPVDILAGGKLSGRIGDWNVGSLIIAQDEDAASGLDSQNIFVGRAVLNLLSESQVGLIATHGSPQSNLDNSLLGADFRYRNSQLPGSRILESHGWVQQTDTEGLNGNNRAYGLGIGSPNSTGLRGRLNLTRIEANFNPAVGFTSRRGIRDYALDLGNTHRFAAGGYLRSLYTGFDSYRVELLQDGSLSSQNLSARFALFNNTNDRLFVRVHRSDEVLLQDFTIYRASDGSQTVVIPAGSYTFDQGLMLLGFSNQRPVSGQLRITTGEYYDGDHTEYMLRLSWRPNRHLELEAEYSDDAIRLPGGNFDVRVASFKANIAFSATWSWSNFIQYDNISETASFNSRLHWIPQAGRQAFLIFNHGLEDRDKDSSFSSTNSDISLKLSYTLRF